MRATKLQTRMVTWVVYNIGNIYAKNPQNLELEKQNLYLKER